MRSCSSTESGLLRDMFSIQFASRPYFLYFPTGLYHGIYDMCIYFIRDYSYVYSDVPTLYFTGHGMADLCTRTVLRLRRERLERSSRKPYLDGGACRCDMVVYE